MTHQLTGWVILFVRAAASNSGPGLLETEEGCRCAEFGTTMVHGGITSCFDGIAC
jgi:hypothetical protein